MQEMYDIIMKHKRTMAEMQIMWEKAVRDHQHEYDSDEEVDQQAGTWEHRLRKMEMEKTRGEAERASGAAMAAGYAEFVGVESCLFLSRVGGVSDRDGKGKTFYWRLPAPRGAGEVHGDFQSAEGQFPFRFRVEHKQRREECRYRREV